MKYYKPMVIMVPRIDGQTADEACKRTEKRKWFRVEASGFSGGIWVLWNKEDIQLKVIYAQKEFVRLSILNYASKEWETTIVCASPNPNIGSSLWWDPTLMHTRVPLCLIGDFNATLTGQERLLRTGALTMFLDMVYNRSLIDMGFIGPRFTWNHKNFLPLRKSARLDRGLCDG